MNRSEFDAVYRQLILDQSFLEGSSYYLERKERYWNTLARLEPFLEADARMLDIGGGQFALLAKRLFRCQSEVADLDSRYRTSIDSAGIPFHHLNLVEDDFRFEQPFQLVMMGEVIGHVPVPPHLVFEKLAATLAPGGRLVITTPNLFRLRNVIRMIRAKPLFYHFMQPYKDLPPGHFIEYDREHMEWQMRRASLDVEVSQHAQLDLGGATPSARVARRLIAPLLWLRPVWKDNLFVVGRKPQTATPDGANTAARS